MMKLFKSYKGHEFNINSVKWHPIHEKIFTSCDESGMICMWDVNQKHMIYSKEKAHRDRISDIAWHPQGSLLVSTGTDKLFKIWRPTIPDYV